MGYTIDINIIDQNSTTALAYIS